MPFGEVHLEPVGPRTVGCAHVVFGFPRQARLQLRGLLLNSGDVAVHCFVELRALLGAKLLRQWPLARHWHMLGLIGVHTPAAQRVLAEASHAPLHHLGLSAHQQIDFACRT